MIGFVGTVLWVTPLICKLLLGTIVPVDAAAWEALGSDEAEGTWLEALL